MGSQRRSGLDDAVELVARLPWWAGLIGGALSYAVFHSIALRPLPAPASPGNFGSAAASGMLRGAAGFAQLVVPLVCLLGAGISAFRQYRRGKLLEGAAGATSSAVVDGLTWREFETLAGEGFRRRGYTVQETGGGGTDGGVDLVLSKGAERYLVQCKQWRAQKVGVTVVRELYGVMAARGAAGGFVVTSGSFTPDAVSFAEGRNVELVDGRKLRSLIQGSARPMKSGAAQQASDPVETAPRCPICGGEMVMRTARRGASAGKSFWGCSQFPACKGTQDFDVSR